MCDKEQLVSYLYDDLGDADRARFETHLRSCPVCREELNALRGVRADLISWTPPQPDFGFRVVREPKVLPMPTRSWRAWYTPAAGLAAAAVLVLAAAASIARVEIHRGPDGITVRTGWSASASPENARSFAESSQAQAAPAAAPAQSVDPALLASLDRRLALLEASARDNSSAAVRAASVSARASDAELLRRVREMLAQSETKQQGQLALRIAQVIRDFDAQRVADLTNIQKGMRTIGSRVDEEAAGHRELTALILSSPKQK